MSYRKEIEKYLKEKGSITSWDSIKLFGNTRLSATIYELRHRYGMNIVSEWKYSRRWWRLFKKTRFVEYKLKKGKYNG